MDEQEGACEVVDSVDKHGLEREGEVGRES